MFKRERGRLFVLLTHPGGPFCARDPDFAPLWLSKTYARRVTQELRAFWQRPQLVWKRGNAWLTTQSDANRSQG